jgi:hypothetical protein
LSFPLGPTNQSSGSISTCSESSAAGTAGTADVSDPGSDWSKSDESNSAIAAPPLIRAVVKAATPIIEDEKRVCIEGSGR